MFRLVGVEGTGAKTVLIWTSDSVT